MKIVIASLAFASTALFAGNGSVSSDNFDWSSVEAIDDGITVVPAIAPSFDLFDDASLTADDAAFGKGKRIKNTTKYPASARVLIEGLRPDGSAYRCSGTMVGYKTVLTAGDCVYSRTGSRYGWNKKVRVTAGKNGAAKGKKNKNPYGICTATNFVSPRKWVVGGNSSHNYGVAILDCNIGKTVGTYGFEVVGKLKGTESRVAGYPVNVKSKLANTQWSYKVKLALQRDLGFYYNLGEGKDVGNLGAAVTTLKDKECGPCVQAVTGFVSGKKYYDYGPYVSKQMYAHIREWKKHYGDKEPGL